MKIIEPSAVLMRDFDGNEVMKFIEKCGRTCYQSEKNITDDSAEKFVRNLIKRGHESVLEHFSATFKIICDRGVMAELTRHRLVAFSIESTRFNAYGDLTFIRPNFFDDRQYDVWLWAMDTAESNYKKLRERNSPPEQGEQFCRTHSKPKLL